MRVCPADHGPDEIEGGFAVYPVPRPLYLHDPPRKAYDAFNAYARRDTAGNLTCVPDYKWGDKEMGHRGVDLGAALKPVRVSADGTVWTVDLTDNSSAGVHVSTITKCPECSGWFLFRYLHLTPGSVRVVKGQTVEQGQVIGTQGKSGNAHWFHSHFEIRHTTNPFADEWTVYPGDWGTPYDPLVWLDAPPPTGGRPSDKVIDWLFDSRLATGDRDYWKGLPASSPEWARFTQVAQGGLVRWAVESGLVKPNEDWTVNYWLRVPPSSPEWEGFWRAVGDQAP